MNYLLNYKKFKFALNKAVEMECNDRDRILLYL